MESVAQMFAGFAVAAFSLTLAWLVGNTLAARLEREKKLTERDVAALTSFQEIYGEFYSVWKEWGNSARDPATATRLLALAARVEGKYEALLVMLCGDRVLSLADRRALGALRQGIQQLRDAIKAREYLDWWSSDDARYRAFKTLTAHVAVILRPRVMRWAGQAPARPSAVEASEALLAVTSNAFEETWVAVAESMGSLASH